MDQFTSNPSQGYASGAFAARVEYGGRFRFGPEWFCYFLFLVGLVSHVGIGIYLKSQQNLEISNDNGIVFSTQLTDEITTCVQERFNSSTLGLRVLANQQCEDLWCLFSRSLYIPLVTIFSVPLIGLVWTLGMYFLSQAIVWFSVLFNIGLYILVGVALLQAEMDGAVPFLFIAWGGVLALLAFFTRAKIFQAAAHLKMAVLALSKNVSVFIATGILELLLLGFLGWHWFSLVTSAKVALVDPFTCVALPYPPKVQRMVQFQSLYLLWVVAYLDASKLVTTAMTVGTWYFGQDDKPSMYPFRAMKATLTTSGGAISVGSLITAIVDALVRKATSQFWWTNPWGCILKCVFLIFQGCIMALTKFALIAHAFTGLPFFDSSGRAYAVLKKNFVGGYVTDRVGNAVMNTFANALSLCIGLAAWYWLDKDNGWNTLTDITGLFNGSLIGVIAFIIGFLWLTNRPLFTILFITLIMDWLKGMISEEVFAPLGGLFVACVAMIILSFQGDVILNAMDTMFMCFAVGKENNLGKPTTDGKDIVYALVVDQPEAIEGKMSVAQA